jgi:hypothetical protein
MQNINAWKCLPYGTPHLLQLIPALTCYMYVCCVTSNSAFTEEANAVPGAWCLVSNGLAVCRKGEHCTHAKTWVMQVKQHPL